MKKNSGKKWGNNPFEFKLKINGFIICQRGFHVDDFNKDDHLDVLIVGNMFVSEIETPRNDAGNGLLMLGDGTGNFSASTNQESGFFANRDAKKIVVISNKKQRKILIANNDDKLQCFTIVEE